MSRRRGSWHLQLARRGSGGCFQTITDDGAIDVDSGHGTHVALSVLSGGGRTASARAWRRRRGSCSRPRKTTSTFQPLPHSLRLHQRLLPDRSAQRPQPAVTAGVQRRRAHPLQLVGLVAGRRLHGEQRAKPTSSCGTTATWSSPSRPATPASTPMPTAWWTTTRSARRPRPRMSSPIGASENARADNECDTGLTYTSSDALPVRADLLQHGRRQTNWARRGSAGAFTDRAAQQRPRPAAMRSRWRPSPAAARPTTGASSPTWWRRRLDSLRPTPTSTSRAMAPALTRATARSSRRLGHAATTATSTSAAPRCPTRSPAGGATLVRDFYQKAYSLNASAALVKATLINTAVDLLDENNDGAERQRLPDPERARRVGPHQPGRKPPTARQQYVDNTSGTEHGRQRQLPVQRQRGRPAQGDAGLERLPLDRRRRSTW
jgi:hypothetical protein